MKRNQLIKGVISAVALLTLSGSLLLASMSERPGKPNDVGRSYLLIANANELPPQINGVVRAAGGKIVKKIPQIGVAVVESSDPYFTIRGGRAMTAIRSVVPNIMIDWLDEPDIVYDANNVTGETPSEMYAVFQWGLDAIDAPEAWETGARGAGVRVAVLDTGMYYDPDADPPLHPDLAANLNIELAASFVTGEDWANPGFEGWHGTHVAGLIAATDDLDDYGVIGVAPEAEIVPIKVIESESGRGWLDWLVAGIVYAGDIDADVINMSLSGRIRHRGHFYENDPTDPDDDVWVSARQHSEILLILNRAVGYARDAGATLVASAGNSAQDLDKDQDWVVWPAEARNVIAVSATAPELWALYPDTDLDVPASYTNYGRTAIHVAAPGGDMDMAWPPGGEGWTLVLFPPDTAERPAFMFDRVLSCIPPDAWMWVHGTSQAAPHVSGVAALIIGKNGGSMDPSKVEFVLYKSADDLGERGHDPYYGFGRVNAYNAVTWGD
ncbi:MAG: S8 family serine peptidase [Phycisphaerales bacterium]|nr:MAG: S8 family serine peptidase [Phycisphaerales bacterium]